MEDRLKSLNAHSTPHAMNAIAFDKASLKDEGEYYSISGYVCHFDVVNENLEMVTKDSFDKFFEKLNKNEMPPKINVQHSWEERDIIGVWDKLTPKEKGLWGEGRIIKNDYTKTIIDKIKFGILDNFSTEGWVTKGRWVETNQKTGDGYYLAENFELLRVSLVDMPADMSAKVQLKENAISFEMNKHTEDEPHEEPFDMKNAIQNIFKS